MALEPGGGADRGRVEAIYLAGAAGAPMRAVDRAEAIAGIGLEGDRYAMGTGHWSAIRRSGDGLTLIEGEVVDEVAARHGLQPGDTRRNIVTRGIRLAALVGKRFRLGNVECRATRLCEPCSYLDGLLKLSVLADLVHRGGVRVDILTNGPITLGDTVELLAQAGMVAGEEGFEPSVS